MKKKHSYRMFTILMAAGLLCSCGVAGEKAEAQMADTQREGTGKPDSEEYGEGISGLEFSGGKGALSEAIRVVQEQGEDLAPYQSIELAAMARAYYFKENDFLAPETECVKNDDGTTTIHLYEIVEEDDGTSHTSTSAWYTVDGYGKGTDDIMGNTVELPAMPLGEIVEYAGTPTAITYSEEGEAHNEWQIADVAAIDACMQAMKQLSVGEETVLRAADAGETLVLRMADGNTWTLEFEAGNLLRNGSCYETTGWREVQNILWNYLMEEELR